MGDRVPGLGWVSNCVNCGFGVGGYTWWCPRADGMWAVVFRKENIVGNEYCGWVEVLFNGWVAWGLGGKGCKILLESNFVF